MKQRRWKLASAQRTAMWSRWKAGHSLHAIGRALGKDNQVIHFLLARHGGIAPATRRRSRRALTLAEREDISRGIASGESIRGIAKGLKRAVSTVSREVARHDGRPLYRASEADRQTWESALRPKTCLLATHSKLRALVASKLMLDWSPEQISGRLKHASHSHSTIASLARLLGKRRIPSQTIPLLANGRCPVVFDSLRSAIRKPQESDAGSCEGNWTDGKACLFVSGK